MQAQKLVEMRFGLDRSHSKVIISIRSIKSCNSQIYISVYLHLKCHKIIFLNQCNDVINEDHRKIIRSMLVKIDVIYCTSVLHQN